MNSESFRLVRFGGGRVMSCTYHGDPQAPIPYPRADQPPVRIGFDGPNDGARRSVTAVLTNDLLDPLPDCRAVFVMPPGEVELLGGRVENATESDEGLVIVAARVDLPAAGEVTITARSH